MGSLHLAVEPWRAGLMRTWSHLPRPSNSRSQDGPGNEDLPARPVKVPRVGRPALDALLREQLLRINAETTSLPRCRRSTARIGWRVGWVAGPADTMTEAGRAGLQHEGAGGHSPLRGNARPARRPRPRPRARARHDALRGLRDLAVGNPGRQLGHNTARSTKNLQDHQTARVCHWCHSAPDSWLELGECRAPPSRRRCAVGRPTNGKLPAGRNLMSRETLSTASGELTDADVSHGDRRAGRLAGLNGHQLPGWRGSYLRCRNGVRDLGSSKHAVEAASITATKPMSSRAENCQLLELHP